MSQIGVSRGGEPDRGEPDRFGSPRPASPLNDLKIQLCWNKDSRFSLQMNIHYIIYCTSLSVCRSCFKRHNFFYFCRGFVVSFIFHLFLFLWHLNICAINYYVCLFIAFLPSYFWKLSSLFSSKTKLLIGVLRIHLNALVNLSLYKRKASKEYILIKPICSLINTYGSWQKSRNLMDLLFWIL